MATRRLDVVGSSTAGADHDSAGAGMCVNFSLNHIAICFEDHSQSFFLNSGSAGNLRLFHDPIYIHFLLTNSEEHFQNPTDPAAALEVFYRSTYLSSVFPLVHDCKRFLILNNRRLSNVAKI